MKLTPRPPIPKADDEVTRHWKPRPAELANSPTVRPPSAEGEFRAAANEQTIIGAPNLRDPQLRRSDRPAPLVVATDTEEDDSVIEFVGALASHDAGNEAAEQWKQSTAADEQTTLYRPQRTHLSTEDATDEYELEDEDDAVEEHGPQSPKVIVSPAVLAGRLPDPSSTEPTRRRRAARSRALRWSLTFCLLGSLLGLGAAFWPQLRTSRLVREVSSRFSNATQRDALPASVPSALPRAPHR